MGKLSETRFRKHAIPFERSEHANTIARWLRESSHRNARAVQRSGGEWIVEVEPGRAVVIAEESESLAEAIVSGITDTALKGDREAADWLEARGVVDLPTKGSR